MTPAITMPVRPLFATGILLGACLLVLAALAAPAVAMRLEYADDIRELRARWTRSELAARELAALRRRGAALQAANRELTGFLQASTVPLAAAELQRMLNVMVVSNGATVVSMQAVSTETEETYSTATVRLEAKGDVRSLQRLLLAIEGNPVAMFVNSLVIEGRYSAPASADPEVVRPLSIRMDVTGYNRTPEGEVSE